MRLKNVQQFYCCLWQQFLRIAALRDGFPLYCIEERNVSQPCIGDVLEHKPMYMEQPLPAVALCPDIATPCVV